MWKAFQRGYSWSAYAAAPYYVCWCVSMCVCVRVRVRVCVCVCVIALCGERRLYGVWQTESCVMAWLTVNTFDGGTEPTVGSHQNIFPPWCRMLWYTPLHTCMCTHTHTERQTHTHLHTQMDKHTHTDIHTHTNAYSARNALETFSRTNSSTQSHASKHR